MNTSHFKSGFIGIVGPTNSGKSTLINRLVGQKISIVSSKPQTTYRTVRGILNQANFQIVFVDTPGFQKYPETVPRMLNQVAEKHADQCDGLIWVFDVSNPRVISQCLNFKSRLERLSGKSHFCILNKIDRVSKPSLLPLIDEMSKLGLFKELIPISAKTGDGISNLIQVISNSLSDSQPYYPMDQVTDRSLDFRVAEIIREKIYAATREEIPYSVWVEVERWEDISTQKCPTVWAVIHVDSMSRKGILIGSGGNVLKEVGSKARLEIEAFLKKQICLKLHVDVALKWREDSTQLSKALELDA